MASNSTLVPFKPWSMLLTSLPHQLSAALFGCPPFFASSTPWPATSHQLQTNQRTPLRFQSLDSRISALYIRMLGCVLPLRPPKRRGYSQKPRSQENRDVGVLNIPVTQDCPHQLLHLSFRRSRCLSLK